ncbi:MAG: hypothetical protein IPP97_13695 [Candidatus Obscuribacter sp.]|jgi:tetratricopeptide (TPR) repeat protein|nr:hypothetical protein [Candidatus Obscuribacter sp.]MBP6593091.1 hypothetical protein [Candidatus Obscuribacter sp.]
MEIDFMNFAIVSPSSKGFAVVLILASLIGLQCGYYTYKNTLSPPDHYFWGADEEYLAVCLHSQRQFREALDHYNLAVGNGSGATTVALTGRAVVKADMADFQGSIADCNQIILIDPTNAFAYRNRGYASWQLGDKEAALADYNTAIDLMSGASQKFFICDRAEIKAELGNAKGANMDLDELLSKDTKFWSAYESRGNIKRHLGDKKGASSEYEKALKACPIPREIEKLKLLKETL